MHHVGDTLGEKALLGNSSTVLDGTSIGGGSLVAAGSVVTPGTEIPAGVPVAEVPAAAKKPIEGTGAQFWVDSNGQYYADLARRHREGIAPVEAT